MRIPSAVLLAAVALPLLAADTPVVVKVSGLSAPVPAGWKSEKPSNLLRSYQLKLPSPDTSHADAELSISARSSPDVSKYFDLWKGQFTPPDGKTEADVTKVSKFEVGPATVHVLDVTGTWKYRERPRDPTSKEEIRPEYRAVWVVLVTKDETTHLRLSGPEIVVAEHYPDFEKWLKSLK